MAYQPTGCSATQRYDLQLTYTTRGVRTESLKQEGFLDRWSQKGSLHQSLGRDECVLEMWSPTEPRKSQAEQATEILPNRNGQLDLHGTFRILESIDKNLTTSDCDFEKPWRSESDLE